MAFNRFTLAVSTRALLLAFTLMGLVAAIWAPGFYALAVLLAILVVLQWVTLNRFIARPHMEMTQFLDAVRSGDVSQRTRITDDAFGSLARQFSDVLTRVESERADQEQRLRHLSALTEHLPVPLISIGPNHEVTVHNAAARHLFGPAPVTRLSDLTAFGSEFHDAVATLEPGHRRLARFDDDGADRQLSIRASRIVTREQAETLISLQDIQSELDANQLQTWHELVRVLTHEIMNSVTPVASLAKTALELMADIQQQLPVDASNPGLRTDVDDACQAVETVARRADGMMQFIQRYRSLTQSPRPHRQTVRVADLFQRLRSLMATQSPGDNLSLSERIDPDTLALQADPDLLEQVLINLLTNAAQATQHLDNPRIQLTGRQNASGQVVLEVIDNGPGIDEAILGRIFVPFYTTKPDGNGVGLALARQIVVAHGGRLTAGSSELGGARFVLTFP